MGKDLWRTFRWHHCWLGMNTHVPNLSGERASSIKIEGAQRFTYKNLSTPSTPGLLAQIAVKTTYLYVCRKCRGNCRELPWPTSLCTLARIHEVFMPAAEIYKLPDKLPPQRGELDCWSVLAYITYPTICIQLHTYQRILREPMILGCILPSMHPFHRVQSSEASQLTNCPNPDQPNHI
jgi:hypothetical protein